MITPTATQQPAASTSAAATDAALASTIFARLHPATYLHRFLASSIRPDGRSFDEARETRLGASTIQVAQGSCVARHGNTIIVAGVRAELLDISDEYSGEADEDVDDIDEEARAQNAGQDSGRLSGIGPADRRRLVVGVDLSPMASPRFKPGPPGQEAQVLVSRLERVLEVCPPFDCSSLVIDKGLMSWCIYVDLVCIAYDGNVFDTALMAINGALQDARLPRTTFDPAREHYVSSPDLQTSASFALKGTPVAFSFAVIDGRHLLSDPNAFEATLASNTVCITLDVSQLGTGRRRDIADIEVIGRCEAVVLASEAKRAGATMVESFEDDDGDSSSTGAHGEVRVRVRDEALLAVCLARARRQAVAAKEALAQLQHPATDARNGGGDADTTMA